MKTTGIATCIGIAGIFMLLKFSGPLKGSTTTDFQENIQPEDNPLPPYPQTSNCVRITCKYKIAPHELFNILLRVLEMMKAFRIEPDLHRLKIGAVFRIPVLGFKDDFTVKVTSDSEDESTVHLSSRSRVGQSDLGVNRRRVKKFLKTLHHQLKLT